MFHGNQSSYFGRFDRQDRSDSEYSSCAQSTTNGHSQENDIAPSDQSQIFSQLGPLTSNLAHKIHDEFLLCKICLDNYTEPKSLACLHTFCQSCIESHISAEVTYNRATDYHHFTCPLCRKRTTLPIGGVKKLPDNFFVSGLAELLSRAHRETSNASDQSSSVSTLTDTNMTESQFLNGHGRDLERLERRSRQMGTIGISGEGECEICGKFDVNMIRGKSSTPSRNATTTHPSVRSTSVDETGCRKATSKCLDCNKLLCVQCVARHKEMRVTREHSVFELAAEKSIACKEHPEEPIRFYCEACCTCICILCTFNNHREHEVSKFGEAVARLRSELQKRIQETELTVERSRKWLATLDEIGDGVHRIECEIRESADKAIDEIHKQEDSLMEELHQRIGRITMQTIERVPEWECQIAHLESVQMEVSELLESQDIDVLLTKTDLKGKLGTLAQLEMTGPLPPTVFPKINFSSGSVCLGKLVTPDTPAKPALDTEKQSLNQKLPHPQPKKSSSFTSTASQTVEEFSSNCSEKPEVREIESEANISETPVQVRHRAVNTQQCSTEDHETNTRPRGINISITFGGDEKLDIVDNYLTAIKDLEESGQDIAFAAMSNLARARLRRKMKERWSTVDELESTNSPEIPLAAFTAQRERQRFTRHHPSC